jgi:hypothetical protein
MLLEFEGTCPEEEPTTQGLEAQPPEAGGTEEDLPECPNHEPSSFPKGKPRSILSLLCFTKCNLSIL